MKEFTKFTNAHNGQALYVNIEAVHGVGEWDSSDTSYNPFGHSLHNANVNGTVTSTTIYMPPSRATVLYCDAQTFYVTEHITEVLALIEGRDPKPARILYGKKDK